MPATLLRLFTAVSALALGLRTFAAPGGGLLLPATGKPVAAFAGVESAFTDFLREHQVTAATLAISREGEILLSRGYGWANEARTEVTPAHLRMRIASLSKVFTAAAVKRLIRDGRLRSDTKVLALLGHDIAKIHGADPRLANITIEHLLRHEGGWDREAAFDPMFIDERVRGALGLATAPTAADIVRYMLTQPLQFNPGTRPAYSNFGYEVLGLAVEKTCGQPLSSYLQAEVFQPLKLASLAPGREQPQSNEVWYDRRGDVSVNMKSRLASGGWIASAPDLCRYLAAYWISGELRTPGRPQSWYFMGSLPGTTALVAQRRDGLDVAVLMNSRARDFKPFNEELRRQINRALDAVSFPAAPPAAVSSTNTVQRRTNRR